MHFNLPICLISVVSCFYILISIHHFSNADRNLKQPEETLFVWRARDFEKLGLMFVDIKTGERGIVDA